MTAILVVLTILALVGVDAVVMALRHRPARMPVRVRAMPEPAPPGGVFVDPGHGWVFLTAEGTLHSGLDDFLTGAVGAIDGVETAPPGTRVERGAPLLTLKVRRRRLVVPSPAKGVVVAVNTAALAEPGALGRDPYGESWLVALRVTDTGAAIRPLRVGNAAAAFLRGEVERLKEFLGSSGPTEAVPVMADGGVPCVGALLALDDGRWEAFQREFLHPTREEKQP